MDLARGQANLQNISTSYPKSQCKSNQHEANQIGVAECSLLHFPSGFCVYLTVSSLYRSRKAAFIIASAFSSQSKIKKEK